MRPIGVAMSDEQSIRDEIERAFNEWWNAPHPDDGSDLDFSECIMPLLRRIQAEAFEAAWRASGEGYNGEWPDEGVPWAESAGREAYERWIERGETA